MTVKYVVRHSAGMTWAVDKIVYISKHHYIKEDTRYFDTEEEARAFKKRRAES